MAAESESGEEKTEEPTGRRISEARNEGQVGQSTDFSQVLGITASVLLLQLIGPYLWQDLLEVVSASFTSKFFNTPLTIDALQYNFNLLLLDLSPEIALFMVLSALISVLGTAIQTKFLWSWKLLKPKFSHLNPIQGIKRLFGWQNMVNILKSLAKLAIICPIAYISFFDLFPRLIDLMEMPVSEQLPMVAYAANYIFWRIVGLLLILAIADLIWQKWKTKRDIKMTKQEVKEEKKSVDGDEETKLQIRQKGLERIRQRMMQDIPTADVVVTNPTHYAVALKYDAEEGAPVVVAKGKGFIAQRIKDIARDSDVPVIERPPLARALHRMVEVGQQIPYELYAAVAELLAYVYKVKRKNPFANANGNTNR